MDSHKTYTSVKILFKQCNTWVIILPVIYWELYEQLKQNVSQAI